MRFPLATATAHLQSLSEGIEVEWVETTAEAAACAGRAPMVWLPKPTTPTKYVVGLHELGHVRHTWDFEPGSMVDEAASWEWAFANVDPALADWLDWHVYTKVSKYLVSHLEWPGRPTEEG